ncbi:beta-glucosidase [Thermaerobacter sp. FW80]|uniref:GH1 family beta-glucosidase n=1 Tax=Thermaerobacter sp. FW80 TaxID=2546351 RepID=UPI001074E96E|nr:GH1 family beta-glucosidase [Thermaerobacter sp. FW80]QBS37747.1 beta-glucosidase [Thermaerobacter sp. FW80]
MRSRVDASRGLAPRALRPSFPEGFLWGAATSAYQIEGSVDADGRGESIWDRFCREPGRIRDGGTGATACDHYRRYREDVARMAELGLKAYRFSVAWPRVFPTGTGPVNPRGLDFYRRLVDALRARAIEPVVTLYHWDLPQALQDRGGWARRDTAARFAEFAATVARALGDGVRYWITLNEPWVVAFVGHLFGEHAPGIRSWAVALAVAHHQLLAHGLAVRALRAEGGGRFQVGITLDQVAVRPATQDEADAAAAGRFDGWRNRWFLDPVLRGRYPADLWPLLAPLWRPAGLVRPGDLDVARARIDFLGVNYYSPAVVRHAPGRPPLEAEVLSPRGPVTAMGWAIDPGGLAQVLLRVHHEYGPLPIMVTENGAAFPDRWDGEPVVDDPQRVAYLDGHVRAVADAIARGVDVRGYFVWSLLDNFEWARGYGPRFGLFYVDYPSQRRVPKASALWYREVIARNGPDASVPSPGGQAEPGRAPRRPSGPPA